jgi:hypothetical protein
VKNLKLLLAGMVGPAIACLGLFMGPAKGQVPPILTTTTSTSTTTTVPPDNDVVCSPGSTRWDDDDNDGEYGEPDDGGGSVCLAEGRSITRSPGLPGTR